MEKIEQSDEVESAEDTLTQCYFIHFSQLPSSMKANTSNAILPSSFKNGCEDHKWPEAIDRDFEALCAQESLTYGRTTSDMKPIPFLL